MQPDPPVPARGGSVVSAGRGGCSVVALWRSFTCRTCCFFCHFVLKRDDAVCCSAVEIVHVQDLLGGWCGLLLRSLRGRKARSQQIGSLSCWTLPLFGPRDRGRISRKSCCRTLA